MLALVAALAPVYWMLTISLKNEVDQFAVPPQVVLVYTDAAALLRRVCDAFVWPIPAHERDRRCRFDFLRARDRHTRGLRVDAFSTSLRSRSQALFVDSFDADVSRDRDCGAAVFDDARLAAAEHEGVVNHRLHRVQPAICGLDDARVFCGSAARSRGGGAGRWRFASRRARSRRVAAGESRARGDGGVLFDRFVERVSVCAGVDADRCVDDVARRDCGTCDAV